MLRRLFFSAHSNTTWTKTKTEKKTSLFSKWEVCLMIIVCMCLYYSYIHAPIIIHFNINCERTSGHIFMACGSFINVRLPFVIVFFLLLLLLLLRFFKSFLWSHSSWSTHHDICLVWFFFNSSFFFIFSHLVHVIFGEVCVITHKSFPVREENRYRYG